MKFLLLLLISTLWISGCASSEKNPEHEKEFQNLVQLNPPGDQKQATSDIYIDSVERITQQDRPALLISGSFPDACTQLKSASHTMANDTLQITLRAWREPDMMCAQVLTAFSYLYEDFPEDLLDNSSTVTVNKRSYPLK